MRLCKSPWRISGIAGILFVVLSFIASGINVMPPGFNQDKMELMNWFAANSDWYRVGHFIAGLAFLLFYFPFFAGFCERLKTAEGAPAIWTKVVWASAIMSPATGTIGGTFMVGAALLGGNVSPETAQLGLSAFFYAYVVSGAFGGIVMLGAAIVILRTGVFRKWLGWAGVVIGLTAVIGLGAIIENDPKGLLATLNGLAWLIYFLWIAALSVELVRIPADTSQV